MGRRCLNESQKLASKERRRKMDAERKRKQREIKNQFNKKQARKEFETNSKKKIEAAAETIEAPVMNTKKSSEEECDPPPVLFEQAQTCLNKKRSVPQNTDEEKQFLHDSNRMDIIEKQLKFLTDKCVNLERMHPATQSNEETRCLRDRAECEDALKREKIKYLRLQKEMEKYPAIAPKEQTRYLKENELLRTALNQERIKYIQLLEKIKKPETREQGTDTQDFSMTPHKNWKKECENHSREDLDVNNELEVISFKPPCTKKGRETRLRVRDDTEFVELVDLTNEEGLIPINHPYAEEKSILMNARKQASVPEGPTFNWRSNLKMEDQTLSIRSTNLTDENQKIPITYHRPSPVNGNYQATGAHAGPHNWRTNFKLEDQPLNRVHPPRTHISESPIYYSGISSGGAVPTAMFKNVSSLFMTMPRSHQQPGPSTQQRSQIPMKNIHPTSHGHLEGVAPKPNLTLSYGNYEVKGQFRDSQLS